MRLFFIGWSGKDLGMIDVVKELKKRHEIIYWTGLDSEADKSQFPGTIFQDHYHGVLEGVRVRGLTRDEALPPSEELLKQLYETESIILTMMNKKFERTQVSERKNLYYRYLSYWHGALNKFKPDAIIFPTIPHTVYDFVIYSLAKLYHIKTVMLEPTWIGDRLVIMTDYKNGSAMIEKKMTDYKNKEVALSEISEDLQEEYKLQNSKGVDATPIFIKNIKNQYSGLKLLIWKIRAIRESILDLSIGRKIANLLQRTFGENLKKEYGSIQVRPDFSKKFIYLPLHYQPERNSSPQGGIYVDQILMAETLSAALLEGWWLYVKEHPTQWLYRGLTYFSYRFRGYYKAMAKLKNVKIVPIETSTYELTDHAQAVATITGTAGWEALARSKPALIFGYPWYQHCPGIFKVNSVDSCRRAVQKIASGYAPQKKEIINYLRALDLGSFHGYIDLDGRKISKLSLKDNSSNIAFHISRVLDNEAA